MPKAFLTLTLLPGQFAICRTESDAGIPSWALESAFFSITRAPAEQISIVCSSQNIPDDAKADRGWRALKFEGPLDIELTGVIASVAEPLANAGIPIFPLATYATDYVFIREDHVEAATRALTAFGHAVRE
jgi:uncharacterized protein